MTANLHSRYQAAAERGQLAVRSSRLRGGSGRVFRLAGHPERFWFFATAIGLMLER